MTRHKVAWRDLFQRWDFLCTDVHGVRTTGMKFTPLGGWSILHTDPVMGVRYFVVVSSLGIELSKPTVYGCNGLANSSFLVPNSTRWEAYITPMVSQVCATTPRLWVMKIKDILKRSIMLRISSRMVAWMVTSSAVVGSSAIKKVGLQLRAMASMTRWRMPPLNSCT